MRTIQVTPLVGRRASEGPKGPKSVWGVALVLLGIALLPVDARGKLVVKEVVVKGKPKSTLASIMGWTHLRPGDDVTMASLAAARDNLLATGLFTRADVFLDIPTQRAVRLMYVDERVRGVSVFVEVEEKQSWVAVPNGSFGAGDRAVGVAYADRNLRGRDLQVAVAAQLGDVTSHVLAAFRHSIRRFGPVEYGIAASYRKKQMRFFDDTRVTSSVPTWLFTTDFLVGWVLSPRLRLSFGTNFFHLDVSEAQQIDVTRAVPAYNRADGNTVALKLYVVYDNLRAPEGFSYGIRFHVKNEVADALWRSEFDYAKYDFRLDLCGRLWGTYPSVSMSWVLIYPTSNNGVPLSSQLRLGGSTLRGYQVDQFYGDTLGAIQIEEQVPVLRNFQVPIVRMPMTLALAGFVDAGLILDRHPGGIAFAPSNQSFFQLARKLSNLEMGVGAGLRVVLPGIAIPALKLDVGYGFHYRDIVFSISIATQRVN